MVESSGAPEEVTLSLELERLESFFVGGRSLDAKRIDSSRDDYLSGAMYVQRLVPVEKRYRWPLVLIHGGALTGVTWETTPDGREGWSTMFARRGFDVLVIDQAWRGRSAPDLIALDPRSAVAGDLPTPWTGSRAGLPIIVRDGGRFPMNEATHFMSQLAPDFGLSDAFAAGMPGVSAPRALPPIQELLDQIGPAVLVTHSQGGHLGWAAAISRPDHVVAIVSIEPGVVSPGLDDPGFPGIPVRIVWGDNLLGQPILNDELVRRCRAIARDRPLISIDELPAAGIRGNGHMMMMEDNNIEIADRIVIWLREVESELHASNS
jgi:pimeloyl-ACP methyl ester carboxylesterase